MSAIYMSQLSAALPLMEVDHHHRHHQDHHQGHFQAFSLQPKDPPILFPFVISSSSSSSSSLSDTTTLSYGSDHHLMQQQQQHRAMLEPQHMIGGSPAGIFAAPFPTVESIRDDMIERSPFDPYDTEKLQVNCGSAKVVTGGGGWSAVPAAKMKITRKMGEPSGVTNGAAAAAPKKPRRRAQAYEDHPGHGGGAGGGAMGQAFGVIRVCSDCNTTKTPLWRSGPCGPKSLCNACGIRQRKARRAMMASGPPASPNTGAKAAAAQSDATVAAQPKVKKEKRADVDRSLPFKKRCKIVQLPAITGGSLLRGGAVGAGRDHGRRHAAHDAVLRACPELKDPPDPATISLLAPSHAPIHP
uniref:GATA-type domain-containing protein n=1 Tax=Oryza brachyantha TaxID=4533 RepID=J3MF69_ORYBR